MIHLQPPEGFKPVFEVSSCFLDCARKILLLERARGKPEPGTWGVPAGKINPGEEPLQTIIRELDEETGYPALPYELSFIRKVFVQYPTYDFIYHMFYLIVPVRPRVRLNRNEHSNFTWLTPESALKIPLIQDLDACIKLYYRIT